MSAFNSHYQRECATGNGCTRCCVCLVFSCADKQSIHSSEIHYYHCCYWNCSLSAALHLYYTQKHTHTSTHTHAHKSTRRHALSSILIPLYITRGPSLTSCLCGNRFCPLSHMEWEKVPSCIRLKKKTKWLSINKEQLNLGAVHSTATSAVSLGSSWVWRGASLSLQQTPGTLCYYFIYVFV